MSLQVHFPPNRGPRLHDFMWSPTHPGWQQNSDDKGDEADIYRTNRRHAFWQAPNSSVMAAEYVS
jgi:hypothetical protein